MPPSNITDIQPSSVSRQTELESSPRLKFVLTKGQSSIKALPTPSPMAVVPINCSDLQSVAQNPGSIVETQ